MKKVFLSASFPDPSRAEESGPSYPADIAAAACAVIEATLRANANLIFGGHPTISPLVLHIAAMLNSGNQVTIYQSEYFLDQLTPEVRRLAEAERANLIFTPAGSDLPSSLQLLRQEMFSTEPDIAFFVGGMAGVRHEFELLSRNARVACVLFETPGGAAANLGDVPDSTEPAAKLALPVVKLKGRAYASLAMRTLAELGAGLPRQSDEF